MSLRILFILVLAIIGTGLAILALESSFKGIMDSFAVIAGVISFGITVAAFIREK